MSPSVHSMASTPDLASDKEGFGQPSSNGFDNQFPSDRYLTSDYTSRTREKYLEASGQRTVGFEPQSARRSCIPTDPKKRRWVFWGIPIAIIVIAGIAVGVAVGVTQGNKSTTGAGSSSGAGNGGSTGGGNGNGDTVAPDDPANNPHITTASGESGSTVTTDLGVQFTYQNDFGGSWAQNTEDPYSVRGHDIVV